SHSSKTPRKATFCVAITTFVRTWSTMILRSPEHGDFGDKKSHPVALRHLSHGQHEPDGSHSLAPQPEDSAPRPSKFQPVPDNSRGTAGRKQAPDQSPSSRRALIHFKTQVLV